MRMGVTQICPLGFNDELVPKVIDALRNPGALQLGPGPRGTLYAVNEALLGAVAPVPLSSFSADGPTVGSAVLKTADPAAVATLLLPPRSTALM